MQKTLQILKALAIASVPLVAAALVYFLLQLSASVKQFRGEEHGLVVSVGDLLQQTQKTVLLGGKLINDSRVTVDNLNKAAIDERFYFEKDLPKVMVKVHSILGNVATATADLHPLLQETTGRVHDLAPIETNAAQLVSDVDVTAKDPHIIASLTNLEAASQQLVVVSKEGVAIGASVQAIAADGQHEVHSLVYPKPIVTIANWTLKGLGALRAWF